MKQFFTKQFFAGIGLGLLFGIGAFSLTLLSGDLKTEPPEGCVPVEAKLTFVDSSKIDIAAVETYRDWLINVRGKKAKGIYYNQDMFYNQVNEIASIIKSKDSVYTIKDSVYKWKIGFYYKMNRLGSDNKAKRLNFYLAPILVTEHGTVLDYFDRDKRTMLMEYAKNKKITDPYQRIFICNNGQMWP